MLADAESEERRDHGAGRADRRWSAERSRPRSCAKKRWNWRWKDSCRSASSTTSRRKKSAACSASSACPMSPIRPSRGIWRRFSSAQRRRQARRDSVQRRLLHSRDLPAARRRCDGALVRPAPADLRKSRSGSGGRGRRGVLFLRQGHRRGLAGARRTAARVLRRHRREAKRFAWCPRGAEEGQTIELDSQDLHLVANKPVSFRLYSSLTRVDDRGRATCSQFAETDDLHLHAPLERRDPLRQSRRAPGAGEAARAADRSRDARNLGRFENQRASLAPAIRVAQDRDARQGCKARGGGQRRSLSRRRKRCIDAAFQRGHARARGAAGQAGTDARPGAQFLAAERDSHAWPTACWNWPRAAASPPRSKLRWLNLCGFCLRPGFGFPGDDFRIEQARRIYAAGLQFANQVQNEIEWWIFWGRVAGGLNKNQQTDIFQRLSPVLLPRGRKRPRVNNSLLREMWRAAASLELLPLQTKTQLGDALDRADANGRDGRYRPVVPRAPGRAQAVLRADQSSAAGRRPPRAGSKRCSRFRRPRMRWSPSRAAPAMPRAICAPATIDIDPRTHSRSLDPGARRRSRRGSRQGLRRRAAVRVGGRGG